MSFSEVELAFNLIERTNRSVFITGKAGTGKTTFLRNLVKTSKRNIVVLAPTGVAAINAGGVTIHSFFGLPLTTFVPNNENIDRNVAINQPDLLMHFRYNKEKRKLIEQLQTLVIDEVSMVRADVIDAIDLALRYIRKSQRPFGGVQLVFIGDMYQLPPVLKEQDKNLLMKYYPSPYFFDAKIFQRQNLITVELKTIYRQDDQKFIDILNHIRHQEFDEYDFEELQKRYKPDFEANEPGYIVLTTHNNKAETINRNELDKIIEKKFFFTADITGEFSESTFPNELVLELKVGAQVMLIRNDTKPEKRYFNGKIGQIIFIDRDSIKIQFDGEQEILNLEKETWTNKQYETDPEDGSVLEKEIGSFVQYPIRLAWAVTIHKSQGLTFDKAIIDAGSSFAPGQVYVALSRCRTLEGIVLKSQITPRSIITDQAIQQFQEKILSNNELLNIIETEQYNFAKSSVEDLLQFDLIASQLRLWNEEVRGKNIPQTESVAELAEQLIITANSLQEVALKFSKQLHVLYNGFENQTSGWEILEERTQKAITYFAAELDSKIVKPVDAHYESYRIKPRVKGYLATVSSLLQQIKIKRTQLCRFELLGKRMFLGNESEFEQSGTKEHVAIDEKGKAKKGETYLITLDLHKLGKSMSEIAAIRSFSIATVASHFSRFIEMGELDIQQVMDAAKARLIEQHYYTKPDMPLTERKNEMGEDFEFYELRMVEAFLRRKKAVQN
jgi:ATP-dependent DNA helicase PIF1